MDDRQVDCAVVVGAIGVNHLCGYWRYFGSPPALLLGSDGRRTLLISDNEAEGAPASSFADEVRTYALRGFGLVPDPTALLVDAAAGMPEVTGATRIAVASELPAFEALLSRSVQTSAIPADEILQRIRLVKDSDELTRICAAYEVAWAAQEAVQAAAQEGISEIELFTRGLCAAQLRAQQPIAFLGDLLAGDRTAEVCAPVRVAGPRRVASGDPVIADLVVGLQGYWGDTAETMVIGGDGEAVTVRAALFTILEAVRRELQPGRTGSEIFGMLSGAIGETFPDGAFPHHGGHGVGLGPLNDPHMIPGDAMPLEAGMVIALEPGVYFAGRFGARVERMFVVTPDGGVELREIVAEAASRSTSPQPSGGTRTDRPPSMR